MSRRDRAYPSEAVASGPLSEALGARLFERKTRALQLTEAERLEVAEAGYDFVKLTTEYRGVISDRSYVLATYALTGFANVASIGIQLGGIGGMAPERRGDLARLGGRALLAGFLATLINACVASMFI